MSSDLKEILKASDRELAMADAEFLQCVCCAKRFIPDGDPLYVVIHPPLPLEGSHSICLCGGCAESVHSDYVMARIAAYVNKVYATKNLRDKSASDS